MYRKATRKRIVAKRNMAALMLSIHTRGKRWFLECLSVKLVQRGEDGMSIAHKHPLLYTWKPELTKSHNPDKKGGVNKSMKYVCKTEKTKKEMDVFWGAITMT